MTEQEWDQAWSIYDSCIDAGGVPAHCEGAAQASFPDFSTTSQGNGGGGSVGQYFGDPGNWAGFAGGITDVVGDIIGIANGRSNYNGDYMPQQQQQDKTLWWIVGGVAAVFLIILLIIVLKK